MKTTYLIRNDKVYFLSPSMPPQERHIPTIEKSKKMLNSLGLNVLEPKIKPYFYMGGTIKDRLKQFTEFVEGDYKMATPIVGGKSCNQLLEKLPYDQIKKTKKIFLGFSDFTSILLAIYARTGLITYHFSDPAGGMGNDLEWSLKQLEILFNQNAEYKVKLGKNQFSCINEGKTEGIILGGNLASLCRLIGTKYCPDFSNAILFLESLNMSAAEVDANIGQLKQSGILDQINGLILGSFFQADKEILELNYSFSQILNNWNFNKKIPTLKTDTIGHFTNNILLPEGLKVKFDSKNGTLIGMEPLFGY